MVELVDINTNDPDIINYSIKLFRLNKMTVTKDILMSRNVTYIVYIPIFSEGYIRKSNNSTQEKNESIMFSEVILPLQQELQFWHDKISHLRPKCVFKLAKVGVLPPICLELMDDVPLCVSCMFRTARRKQWRTKVNKLGSIRK